MIKKSVQFSHFREPCGDSEIRNRTKTVIVHSNLEAELAKENLRRRTKTHNCPNCMFDQRSSILSPAGTIESGQMCTPFVRRTLAISG